MTVENLQHVRKKEGEKVQEYYEAFFFLLSMWNVF